MGTMKGDGRVFMRGAVAWIDLTCSMHGRVRSPHGPNRAAAERAHAKRVRQKQRGECSCPVVRPPEPTLREQYMTWLAGRADVKTLHDDRTRVETRILPARLGTSGVFGDMLVVDIETHHVSEWIAWLKRQTGARGRPLSDSYRTNVYANLASILGEAKRKGVVDRNACDGLQRHERPRKANRGRTARGYYTGDALGILLGDPATPLNRRVSYAIMALAGCRFGEAAGLRWGDYDQGLSPLGLLRVERQYDGAPLKGSRGEPGPPRDVPVHPVLSTMLDEWRRIGFAQCFGRLPHRGDFLVPSLEGPERHRTVRNGLERLKEDCARLGIAPIKGARPTIT